MANKNFSMKCWLLPAFNIVPLGPVVSLELFVSRAYVASYHAYHIYPHQFFLRRGCSFTVESFCREFLMFLPSIKLVSQVQ